MWRCVVLLALTACRFGFDALDRRDARIGGDDDGNADGDGDGGGTSSGDGAMSDAAPSDTTTQVTNDAAGDAALGANNIIFLTSSTVVPGQLGSLATADAECAARAAAAGLGGTYRAWISTSTANAITRLGTARGWVRPDGRPFVDTQADLLAGRVFYTPNLDEQGTYKTLGDYGTQGTNPIYVLTGTNADGTVASADNCSDYTTTTGNVRIGHPNNGRFYWTSGGNLGTGCNVAVPFYCFGIDRTAAIAAPAATGKRMFVSSTWTPGGGLASADARCAADATAAGLSGTYSAALATSTAKVATRFPNLTQPPIRVDRVALAASVGDFWSGRLIAVPGLTAAGAHLPAAPFGDDFLWSGSVDAGRNSRLDETCGDWLDTGQTGLASDFAEANPRFLFGGSRPCTQSRPLYCIEQ